MTSFRLVCAVIAATLLCGCSGDDAADNGRVIDAQPSDNVRAMIEALEPGDTLILHEGTYDVTTAGTRLLFENIHGSPSSWITVRAADGVRPVLQGQFHNNIEFLNSSYIRISGLDLVGGSDAIKITHSDDGPSHNLRFEDLRVTNPSNNGFGIQAAAHEIHVYRCEFSHAKVGLYWGRPDGTGSLTNSSLRRSLIFDCSDGSLGYGIQIKNPCRGNIIEDNVFVRVAGTSRAAIAFYWSGSDDPGDMNVIRRNVIWDVPQFGQYTNTAAIWGVDNARIENNIIFNAGVGIDIQEREGNWPRNLSVLNNTIYNCRYGGIRFGTAASVADPRAFGASNAIFRGPDSDPSGYSALLGTQTGWVLEGNVTGDLAAAAQALVSTAFGDPDFLYPKSSGPLIGAGSATHYARDDFNGSSRPKGGRAEAGAYEYNSEHNPGWTIGEEEKVLRASAGSSGCSSAPVGASSPVEAVALLAGACVLFRRMSSARTSVSQP